MTRSRRRRYVQLGMALALLVATLAVVPVAPRPAGATGPNATARQLAGSIPVPYLDTRGSVKLGDQLFVIDGNAIDRIDLTTSVWSVFAGDRAAAGSADGYGATARFDFPAGLATDGDYLYVADSNNQTIRRVHPGNGQVSTIAGQADVPGSADGIGVAARFSGPSGLVVSPDKLSLYVTDVGNRTVRKLTLATAAVTTVAGTPGASGSVDGVGAAARFESPRGITSDGAGVLWVTDGIKLRRLVPSTRAVTTRASFANLAHNQYALGVAVTGGFAYVAAFYFYDQDDGGEEWKLWKVNVATGAMSDVTVPGVRAKGLFTDGAVLWAAEQYRFTEIILATGATRAAGGVGATGHADGAGAAARFTYTSDSTSDGTNLYVTDFMAGAIRKVVIGTGAVTTLATGIDRPLGITRDGTNLYVAAGAEVKRIVVATGQVTTLVTLPPGTAQDLVHLAGHLYLVHGDCVLYDVTVATATHTALAGSPGQCDNYTDGTGSAAHFGTCCGTSSPPRDITTDGSDLWVADGKLRKVVIATALVTTVVTPGHTTSVESAGGSLYLINSISGPGPRIYRRDSPGGPLTIVMPFTGNPLTYTPALASATGADTPGYGAGSLTADSGGHRLFFTNSTGVAMLTDTPHPPELSIGDVALSEGDGGSGLAVLTVRLSSPQPRPVTVGFLTNDGTATAGGGDYAGQSGLLTFPPGVVEQRVRVTVNGDAADEADESFKVRLVWPSGGAVVARPIGTATVLDDDPSGGGATLAIGDVSLVEGDDAGALAVFPVRLSSAQPGPVSVNFGTADGTATAASGDYDARVGTLNLPTGVTSATVFVKVNGDYDPEALEAFTLTIAGSSGPTINRATGTGGVIDDD